jgi:endonuclease YncB( thermonuclease family)
MAILRSLRVAAVAASAPGAACAPREQGEGHVAEIIDGRSFRLTNGREIRLAGIEGLGSTKADRAKALPLRS